LQAASEHRVRSPIVEAGLSKEAGRGLPARSRAKGGAGAAP
jgi:hypothetical protein